MPAYLPPLLAFGIPLLGAAVLFLYCKHVTDGRHAPIVVVDRRTMRLAQRRITEALDDQKVMRAYAGLTSLTAWLRYEIRTGPARARAELDRALACAETQKNEIAELVGRPGHRR